MPGPEDRQVVHFKPGHGLHVTDTQNLYTFCSGRNGPPEAFQTLCGLQKRLSESLHYTRYVGENGLGNSTSKLHAPYTLLAGEKGLSEPLQASSTPSSDYNKPYKHFTVVETDLYKQPARLKWTLRISTSLHVVGATTRLIHALRWSKQIL